MSAPKKLDTQTETQVVARIARGDKHQDIVDWLNNDLGVQISVKTITVIKERNKQSLDFMRSELAKHEMTHATSILQKSRRLIDKKLDKAMTVDEELTILKQQLDDGEIEDQTYWHARDIVQRNAVTMKDLTSVAKESFNQSQIEAGKPTSITESPEEAKRNLATLLAAINNGDQQSMLKAIFPDA